MNEQDKQASQIEQEDGGPLSIHLMALATYLALAIAMAGVMLFLLLGKFLALADFGSMLGCMSGAATLLYWLGTGRRLLGGDQVRKLLIATVHLVAICWAVNTGFLASFQS